MWLSSFPSTIYWVYWREYVSLTGYSWLSCQILADSTCEGLFMDLESVSLIMWVFFFYVSTILFLLPLICDIVWNQFSALYFLWISLAIWGLCGSIYILRLFFHLSEKYHWTFHRDFIESVFFCFCCEPHGKSRICFLFLNNTTWHLAIIDNMIMQIFMEKCRPLKIDLSKSKKEDLRLT